MGAPSKKVRKIRSADEFQLSRLFTAPTPPISGKLFSWTLEAIVSARDDQSRGVFQRPVQLAAAFRTDDALAVPYETRLAPQRCIKVELSPAKGVRGQRIADEAEGLFGQTGVGVSANTLATTHGTLVNHGIAIGIVNATAREDGSRVDFSMAPWPLEAVRWDETQRSLVTRVEGGADEQIVHGDGRWVVFCKHDIDPWRQEAALLPAALVWARHAFGLKDWAKGSAAHGNAKVVGTLGEGIPLQQDGAVLSDEAAAFLELLKQIGSGENPVGIKPFGSEVDFLSNSSSAWQVFDRLVLNAEKAGARIYLGTDAMLGSQGGAPGVDIESLFGVAATRVESDLRAIERALLTGVIEPWCAVNFGDSTLAPQRLYKLPDRDADATRDAEDKRRKEFFDAIENTRKTGFLVDQSYVDALAIRYDIEPPTLPEESEAAPQIALAPTDIARVVSVNEARASAGLGPLQLPIGGDDPDGRLTIEEYSSKKFAQRAVPAPVDGQPPQASKTFAERQASFFADLQDYREHGFVLDQDKVVELARAHGVPVPRVKLGDTPANGNGHV